MKYFLIAVVIAVGLGMLVRYVPNTTEIVIERDPVGDTAEETMEVVEEQVDPIELARQELGRISNELDVQEQTQLAARASTTEQYEAAMAALKAQHKADIASIDAELDRIRETRVGFQ